METRKKWERLCLLLSPLFCSHGGFIMKWRKTCRPHNPATYSLRFISPPASRPCSFVLHGCRCRRRRRPQSPLKQTSVGSLSSSTGCLHHNRSPAVMVDFLPATTLRREEGLSSRAAQVPLWHIKHSQEVGSGSKRELFRSHVAYCAKLVRISSRRWRSSLGDNKVPVKKKKNLPSIFIFCVCVCLHSGVAFASCIFFFFLFHAKSAQPLLRAADINAGNSD